MVQFYPGLHIALPREDVSTWDTDKYLSEGRGGGGGGGEKLMHMC